MNDKNLLYYGDNLPILRDWIKDESVDLIYLDPPFNSKQVYNVIFDEKNGSPSVSQARAFDDTWHWRDLKSREVFREVASLGGKVSDAIIAFEKLLGGSNMLAYLSMMALRLVELHRVLKPTGSIYFHCDPTASHYLKVLLDAIFGPENFNNEIIWKRSSAHSDSKQGMKRCGRIHDVILFYSKGEDWSWNQLYTPYDDTYVNQFYRYVEEGTERRYRRDNLTAAKPGGDTSYEWKGVKPYKGRYWAYSKEKMKKFDREGRL